MRRHSQPLRALLLSAILAVTAATIPDATGARAAGGSAVREVNRSSRAVSMAALPDVAARTAAVSSASVMTGSGAAPLASFAGTAGTICGGQPCADPGDPYVAVASGYVVETTAQSIRITDRAGNLLKETSLASFFGPGAGAQRQARVVWDSLHARWLASERDDDCQTGFVSVAASSSADPTGGWMVWLFSRSGYAADLPSIGVSSDKVAIGLRWRAMTTTPSGCDRTGAGGAGGYVFDAATLYGGGDVLPFSDLGLVASVASWRPAVNLSDGADLQLIAALPAGTNTYAFGYATITGRVADETISRSAVANITTGGPSLPGWQGADGSGGLSIDWQPADAVWRNGALWTVVTELCTPSGDTAARPCVRAVGIATGGAPAAIDDLVVGNAGQDVFEGGVGLAGEGTVFVAWSQAPHGTKTVSTYASYRLASDAAHTLRTPTLVAASAGAYTGTAWGRQLGVGADALDPRAVWIAAPYSAASGGWATTVSQIYEAGPVRYAGEDRFATAAFVSARTFPAGSAFGAGVDVAYIAYAFNFPDALAGAAAAGTVRGPVLLTASSGPLAPATAAELTRLKPKRIVVLGSTGVVGADVATALSTYAPRVDRYSGADRFGTAADVSAHTFPAGSAFGAGVDVAYIAYAFNFPDALAGAAAAGTVHGPVLLADSAGTLNAATQAELVRLAPKRIVVLGSSAVVGDDVVTQLQQLAPAVTRYSGADRFATAAAVSANTFPAGSTFGGGVDVVYVAYAFNFPDALAGAAAAGTLSGPVLLAATNGTLEAATSAELARLKPKKIVILGSAYVLGADVGQQLAAFVPH